MNPSWSNVLRGCAFGDAWGHTNEFKSYAALTEANPRGPELPERLIVTDDTQMTLSLARALNGAASKTDAQLRDDIVREFVLWLDDPDNNRAPGNTCLAATHKLAQGKPWTEATVPRSDGCGTVMRVSPAAFLPANRWGGVAAWQAAATHGAAAGIAASVLTAATIRLASRGGIPPGEAVATALELSERQALRAHVPTWLDGHPLAASAEDIEVFFDYGCDTVRDCLQRANDAVDAFQADPWAEDPCAHAGEGWRAQETLAVALLCVDALPDQPVEALRRATVTGGDSDSIAAVAGALLGAMYPDPWPEEWHARLEPRYRDWIAEAERYEFGGTPCEN